MTLESMHREVDSDFQFVKRLTFYFSEPS